MKLKYNVTTTWLALTLFLQIAAHPNTRIFASENELKEYLQGIYENDASTVCSKASFSAWDFAVDINNIEKEQAQASATLEAANFDKVQWETHFRDLNPDDYQDETVKRQVKKLTVLGTAALSTQELTELTNIENEMTRIYSTAKICPYNNEQCNLETEGLNLEPDIESIIANSKDYKELEYVWAAWRNASGAKIKDHYERYVSLSNEAAKANKFNDLGEIWRAAYESETFIEDMDKLWLQVKPLYDELHRYTRRKLKEQYGDELDISDGLIPAHVLGNMWAQSWVNLYPSLVPYPDESDIDVTAALNEKGYTVHDMFEIADEFYTSLGLESNRISYDEEKGAMITKPTDREVLCHASAWDFCNGIDYRIKMCTELNYEDFITIHHEMGHIAYDLSYKNQPITLRTGANPGFHEAVGDTIALSVATPTHLQKIGLLDNYVDSERASINALMNMALERVAFLPFGLLIDKWRWDVFAEKVPIEKWNSHWWHYRNTIQKVKAPSSRSDSNDFDPGAKYHIPGNSQYINYFVAHILEFQLYRGLCKTAGQYDPQDPEKPLHKCDIYESTTAGDKLKAGLSLGASKHWKDALEAITGERDLDATAILEYFAPLYKYLKEQNGPFSEEEFENFLKNDYELQASQMSNQQALAEWDFATDVSNPEKEEAQVLATLRSAEFTKQYWNNYFKDIQEETFQNEQLIRQAKSLKLLGHAALDNEKLTELTNLGNWMTNIYSTAKICPFEKQNCNLEIEGLSLEPDIEGILSSSTNYDELTYVWNAWRSASGAKIRERFGTYVQLSNEAAVANGFDDKGAMWRNDYESETFIEDMDKLWEQVKPLYDKLHTYTRKKLKQQYGDKMDDSDGLIPVQLLGNMWAQSWTSLSSLLRPFPNATAVDITTALKEQNYTPLKMFQLSDYFYRSLGLPSNEMSYDESKGAMITKPNDREVLCHASAWDFSDGEDFRIKMCTEVDHDYFITIHHEMGHIQYYLQYKDQPITFRTGANPGFHEAIGDTIALSVATPTHLQKVGLLENYEESKESDLNALMNMALEGVAFLPFGLLIDKWRWDVFSGTVEESNWNERWWHYRETIQKVKAPGPRLDPTHFDPAAKYHVAGDSQYINYFVSNILQFQLYRALCIAAGEYDPNNKDMPLHKCDFYESKAAGDILKAGLSLGSNKHWKDALEVMTGQRELDASAILEYFEPLSAYLDERNSNMNEEELTEFLNEYGSEALTISNQLVHAEWNVATDIGNPANEQAQLQAVLNSAKFSKNYWTTTFQYLKEENYENEFLKRQIRSLKVLGEAALDEDKLEELTNVGNEMTAIYSTAKICPYQNENCNLETEGLNLEPEIEQIIASSSNYDELQYAWKAWRDASGKKMKDLYKSYVALSNEAALQNGFKDKGDLWRSDYEADTFVADMEWLWEQVKPLYNELHRYAAKKLKEKYNQINITDGLIPAHVLGNMWAQSWINLSPLLKPYPEVTPVDVTKALQEKGYDALMMFQESDEFYKSLGLEPNDMSYDESKGAMITKPSNREVLCHASAWDFYDGVDFRIKMCTEVDYEDFITIHHEMGHIQYFLLYKNQPITFRDGANPGFHEAVGDTIALSVATPNHLVKIGLLDEYDDTLEASLNSLMDMALERVAFLPFGLLIDKWRWDVFSEEVSPEEWNSHWWRYRESIQKVKSPVPRSNAEDFDPGAKYHIPGNSQYINYFVAHILEFQLYRELCKIAGQYEPGNVDLPLHKCDFYNSKEVGDALRNGLSLGSSKHWKDALEAMTGERDLDATAILEYFDPLFKYLKQQNGPLVDETEFTNFLKLDYESAASKAAYDQTVAEWNFVTDVANPDKQQAQLEATLRSAQLTKFYWDNYFKELSEENYQEEFLKRQIKFLGVLGNAALDAEKLEEFTSVSAEMTNIYSTAKICPYNNQQCNLETEGLSLEPDIESIIATSTDYNELQYVWKSWRDASGAKIKEKYPRYVELSNEAARSNGFQDKGDMWRSKYESDTFINDMDKLWEDVKPLYDELHEFVLNKLKSRYGDQLDSSDGLIPAHLLGNMWGQSWTNLFEFVKPYPDASEMNVTNELIKNGYTPLRIFETSNDFYTSLGLESNEMSYNESLGAVIVKPDDREILCHASAWDFSNGKDFRIKMCTEVNYEDFITVHHEMGHIEYYILYKDQPAAFRDGANPGFHEAVGDTIALSVATPNHLKKIGLLSDNYEDTEEAALNTLMNMALERVAFLPFGLLIDKWRWDVFSGNVLQSAWNSQWWHYRQTLQKVKAPVERSDQYDFDPGAKFHIPGDSQYINYFVARILQFQLYRSLCITAGQYNPETKEVPLFKCDFYNSKEAGAKLRAGLSLGSRNHWKDALEAITGERELKADALLEYFEPLREYFKVEVVPDPVKEEDVDQTVPIVVGSVLGVILIGGVSFFGYKRYKQK